MAATRSLYRSVAHDISTALDRVDTDPDSIALVTRSIADSFKRDNRNFRFDKFFEACGLDSFGYVKGTQHV